MKYPFMHSCNPDSKSTRGKYWKYKNAVPSTQKYAPIIAAQLLDIIQDKIAIDIKRIYHLTPESIRGIDLKHAVIRELSYLLNKEVFKIERFEQENYVDIRNHIDSDSKEEDHDNK